MKYMERTAYRLSTEITEAHVAVTHVDIMRVHYTRMNITIGETDGQSHEDEKGNSIKVDLFYMLGRKRPENI